MWNGNVNFKHTIHGENYDSVVLVFKQHYFTTYTSVTLAAIYHTTVVARRMSKYELEKQQKYLVK